ncbi:uncharacterized protein BO88DRAFT_427297 [Aspergillus vadensis CBS 113365]|uniref:HMG box domain-containing protein n=1 Tax=Aspergillus vadensis (strain CBS 113365 / IMI 142717 / IBT 24658) TaxID=1448311 RepID=A0A319BVJ3_ASPVC|nr:hypothetical protein BO88DRAFT_427297 [Aspergillus vadensis CBS 113365]PYH67148.1 hypothetical protein BO88DRAFT_427297 [Aspergillus vadensis CBS 113365]
MSDGTQAHANSPIPEKSADADRTKSEPLRQQADSGVISRQDLDLPCPLSALTNGMQHIPVRDMYAWVHRPVETRRQEARQQQDRIPRPPNLFILYRLAYSNRAKHWLAQNNHQAISISTGQSWKLEVPHIREKYKTLAVIEKRNHAKAHPG